MAEFKYIVVKVTNYSLLTKEVPFIFPKEMVHSLVYESVLFMYRDGPIDVIECVSAGFIDLESLDCYGDSETLKVKSREEVDTCLIRMQDYGAGIL